MPKMKTKRAAAKRFKLTATGKIKFKKAGMRHNTGKHSSDVKRPKRAVAYTENSDRHLIMKCLPYA